MTAPQPVEAGDPLERACEGCTAEPGEPCRPGCLSHPDPIQEDHAMTTTDTTTEDRSATEVDQVDPDAAAPVEMAPALAHLDPRALLVDLNIRAAKLDKQFLASVKRHGVLVPVVAVTTESGVRVRTGHRRILAAVAAGLATVPVYVTGAEDDDAAARIVGQWVENEHRAGLSNVERVEAITQLSLYGLSPAQIATRTTTPKRDVAAALTIAGNELAAKATARYDFLTLDQAAALTRYEHDHDTVTALVAAAQLGPVQFERVLAKADADAAQVAADQARRAAATAALSEVGCRVIDRPEHGDGTVRLSRLLDAATGADLTADSHAACPGHAAWLDADWEPVPEGEDDPDADDDGYRPVYVAVYVCTEPGRHRDRWTTPTPASTGASRDTAASGDADGRAALHKAEQTAHRREVIASNRSWRQSEPIRRDWLRALLARRTAPKGTAAFLAATLAEGTGGDGRPETTARAGDLLGVADGVDVAEYAGAQSDARALVAAAAVAVAGYENGLSIESWRAGSWRGRSAPAARYFAWLAGNGYPLCEVERLAGGLPATDPAEGGSADAEPTGTVADAEGVEVEQDGMVA